MEVITPPAPAQATPAAPAAGTPPAKPADSAGKPDLTVIKPDAKGSPPAGTAPDSIKKEASPADPDKPYEIKADGKVYHVNLEEALRLASRGIGADNRFQSASRTKAQVETFLQTLKTNPMSILTNPKLGIDFKKLAVDYIKGEIEMESMSPEQRELHDAKEKLKEAEEEKKTVKEKADAEQMERLVQHFHETIEKDIVSALEASKLPRTRGTVKRFAYYMDQGLQRGIDLKASDVVDFVRNDLQSEIKEFFGVADGELMASLLGDENIKKLNATMLKKIGTASDKPEERPAPSQAKPSARLNPKEWNKMLDDKLGIE